MRKFVLFLKDDTKHIMRTRHRKVDFFAFEFRQSRRHFLLGFLPILCPGPIQKKNRTTKLLWTASLPFTQADNLLGVIKSYYELMRISRIVPSFPSTRLSTPLSKSPSRGLFVGARQSKEISAKGRLHRDSQRRQQVFVGGRRHFNSKEPVRPYSDSLPSAGYEWCPRCQIRTHRFQKPIGQHNSCLDAPRLFGLGVCRPAKQYYQQQVNHMIFLTLFTFAVAPIYNSATQNEWED